MPEEPMTPIPDFSFFGDAGDEDDHRTPMIYPTRDFEMGEIERLQAENKALRGLLPDVETVEEAHEIFTEWAAAYAAIGNIEKDNERLNSKLFRARQALAEVYNSVPVHIQERLERLRAILERE